MSRSLFHRVAPARKLAVLAAAFAVSSCAGLVPRLETPRLSVVGIELESADMLSQQLRVRMRVQNPNDRALPVKGLDYRLEVEGEDFATGVLGTPFTVPAFGESEFDMRVTANIAGALFRLLTQSGEPKDAIRYRMTGRLSLSQGLLRSIPFEHAGSLALN